MDPARNPMASVLTRAKGDLVSNIAILQLTLQALDLGLTGPAELAR
jgi:hypothetical protein